MRHVMQVKTVEVTYDDDANVATQRLDQPQVVGDYLLHALPHMGDSDQEIFGILALDARHHLIGQKVLALGTANQAPVDANKLFRTALMLGAVHIILFHTHPSGDLQPSRDDCDLTKRLVGGGRLIGIEVLDHIIAAGGRWISLRASQPSWFAQGV